MNTQENQTDFIDRLRDTIKGSTVTPAEMMSIVKAIMKHVKSRTEALFSAIQGVEARTKSQHTATEKTISILSTEIKSLQTALSTKKGRLELEQDLKDIWNQIEHIVVTMPSSYNDTAIRAALTSLSSRCSEMQQSIVTLSKKTVTADDIEDLEEYIQKFMPKASSKSVGNSMPPADFGPFHESFAMDGNTTVLTLSRGIGAQGTAVMVRYNGQLLDLGSQYTVNGNQITLLFTPADTTTISVTYWGG